MASKNLYEKRKRLGICTRCGKEPANDDFVLCKACRDELKGKYWVAKNSGLCVRCRKRPARLGKTRCADCAALDSEMELERKQVKLKEHRCYNCGAHLPDGYWYTHCEKCRETDRMRRINNGNSGKLVNA